MTLSIIFSATVCDMRAVAPVMNDPWGEVTRLLFDERCRCD